MNDDISELFNILEYINSNFFGNKNDKTNDKINNLKEVYHKDLSLYKKYVIEKGEDYTCIPVKDIQNIHTKLLNNLYEIHDIVLDFTKMSLYEEGKAIGFKQNLKGAELSRAAGPADGPVKSVIRYRKNGRYIDLDVDGTIVSFEIQ